MLQCELYYVWQKMAHPSPSKFPSIDNSEAQEVRRALQVVCVSY